MEIFLPSTANKKHDLSLINLFKMDKKNAIYIFTYSVLAVFKKSQIIKQKLYLTTMNTQPVIWSSSEHHL